ncbi:MAG: dolichyl-phosphate beta-glucosyltransferase [archaeon]
MDLSIVMPAYNEDKRIKKSLIDIIKHLNEKKIVYELIVVDDGSSDKTVEIVNGFQGNIRILKNKTNSGKGFSVRKGIENAKYDLVLFTDADLATPIEELDKMLKEMELGADIVIASRNLPKSNIVVKQPFYRQIMGKTFPFLVRLLLIPNIRDTQCGFKLFRTNIAKQIVKKQTIHGFSFDVEILFIARKLGFKIKEVPVKWIDKKGSKVNPLTDAFKMFMDLIRIRHNFIMKKYG